MAGQLKVNGVTLATEESGTVTLEAPQIKDSSNNVILDQSGTNPVLKNVEVVNNSSMMFRNKIINGDMRIDQRNAGSSVTVTGNALFFTVDRFAGLGNGPAGVFTLQQDSSAPAGFVNSIKATVTTIDSSISSENYRVQHKIEGSNVADLSFGTASAKTITLSFWVRSSETGVFGASIKNSAANRSYPFTYSISSADTWEYKTVTITGDTTGTWLTDTGIGIWITWSLGGDANNTAGAWVGSNSVGATGQINLMATLNATWYITGVQLEEGTVATPFEHRPYGMELSLCQRYYWRMYSTVYNFSFATASGQWLTEPVYNPVTMRAQPTVTVSASGSTGTNNSVSPAPYSPDITFLYLQADQAWNDVYVTGLELKALSEL